MPREHKPVKVEVGFPLFILFCIFLILKLTGYIAWSWWWVTSPLWLPFVVASTIFIVGAVIAVLFFSR